MKNINKKLYYSLKWLSLESLIYNAIFLLHQLFLLKICGYKLYGSIGAIFSVVYLAVTMASFGLESSLSPFFREIIKNKQTFRKFFTVQLIPTIALSLISIPVFIILKNMSQSIFASEISHLFIFLLSLLVLSESIKKTLRGILYLAFKNKTNMYIEISSILSYVAAVWLCYAITRKITIKIIFTTMIATSFLSCFILFIYVLKFYSSLKNNPDNLTKKINLRALKCRFFNFTNQFSHSLFSGNFLVPFFAIQFGLECAGLFKFLSHITYTITMLMRKIFGWTSEAVMSYTKNLSLNDKQNIFDNITQKIYHIMIALLIFFSINICKITKFTNSSSSTINWTLIYFFVFITLIENLFISYEKFYIAEEKNSILLVLNIFSIFTLSGIIAYSQILPQALLLFFIATTRAMFFAILCWITFYVWEIRPKLAIKPLFLAASVVASMAIFVLL